MKPRHVKKPHNDHIDVTQAAIPKGIMSDDLREQIAKRAYELYLERGCRQGGTWKIGSMRNETLALPRIQA